MKDAHPLTPQLKLHPIERRRKLIDESLEHDKAMPGIEPNTSGYSQRGELKY